MKVSKIPFILCISALITFSSCAKEEKSTSGAPTHGDSGHVYSPNGGAVHSATDGHNHDSTSVTRDSASGHSSGDGHAH